MYEFFALWALGFWLMVGLELIVLVACVEFEKGILATLALGVFVVALKTLVGVDVFQCIHDNPLNAGVFLAAYFAIGVVWATFKLWLYSGELLRKYEGLKADWIKYNCKGPGVDFSNPNCYHLRPLWTNYLKRCHPELAELPPKVSRHKARLMLWMSLWPVSIAWSLVDDLLRKVWSEIYLWWAGVYQSIFDNRFAGVKDEVEPPAEHSKG